MSRHTAHNLSESANSASTLADDDTECLSALLKRSTQQAHRSAERSGFIRQLIKREATRAGYVCYLRNLHPVYQTLEQGLSELRQSGTCPVLTDPALRRSEAIESDLSVLAGVDWRDQVPMLDSAASYAKSISRASTAQLLAHVYVRYLGDLNGGLIIKRLLRDSLAFADHELAFYDFPAIVDVESFRLRFKQELDNLEPKLDTAEVIDAALLGFTLATRLSIDIENQLA